MHLSGYDIAEGLHAIFGYVQYLARFNLNLQPFLVRYGDSFLADLYGSSFDLAAVCQFDGIEKLFRTHQMSGLGR